MCRKLIRSLVAQSGPIGDLEERGFVLPQQVGAEGRPALLGDAGQGDDDRRTGVARAKQRNGVSQAIGEGRFGPWGARSGRSSSRWREPHEAAEILAVAGEPDAKDACVEDAVAKSL